MRLPEIDEKEIMKKIISEVQSVVSLPLQIDSANYDVIEAAVRIYNGKPIINSVNGKKESMEKIFPIAKKYGTYHRSIKKRSSSHKGYGRRCSITSDFALKIGADYYSKDARGAVDIAKEFWGRSLE